MNVDLFLVSLLILACLQGVASLLLLVFLGIGYAVVYVVRHARPAMRTYGRFLSWAFGTRIARYHRRVIYVWFIATVFMYFADLASAEPGLPRTGNLFTLVMFSIAAVAVFADHFDYFWKHASEPA